MGGEGSMGDRVFLHHLSVGMGSVPRVAMPGQVHPQAEPQLWAEQLGGSGPSGCKSPTSEQSAVFCCMVRQSGAEQIPETSDILVLVGPEAAAYASHMTPTKVNRSDPEIILST
ncbi:hypothetical protein JOB18_010702 [Solea senegalensis]|uniref:Uncharacterized protein n=1 Tax=Solea senegalensis TaxID=28829 RepID=A0AAV6RJ25_SOLSE|nr:hypothetical protein JOB18_010702 [Solea senegalensis]